MGKKLNAQQYIDGLRSGDRSILAQAITLVESHNPSHRKLANQILEGVLTQNKDDSLRIGITGVPGVGKSTFIEALGSHLISQDHRVAVLAIDPSSTITGGSILGDKTRMPKLSNHPQAYVRPSPTRGALGGVSNTTREAILLCEAAGYDIAMIETVGVGQSEIQVSQLSDIFLTLLLPGGGDELQGIKRGILEVTDILIINKADGDLEQKAKQAASSYRAALPLIASRHDHWQTPVQTMSALNGTHIQVVWDTVIRFIAEQKKNHQFLENRSTQRRHWMWSTLNALVIEKIKRDEGLSKTLKTLEDQVSMNKITALHAAETILKQILR